MLLRLLALALSVPLAAHAQGCIATRDVPLDEITDHALSGSIPLAMPVPARFQHVNLKDAPPGHIYWMVPGEEIEGKGQGASGYVMARIAGGIYDQAQDAFTGIDELREKLDGKGIDVASERVLVHGYPVLFVETEDRATHTKAYSMFVATNEESSAIMVKFRPADGDATMGACYWQALKSALRAAGQGDASASGPQSRDDALMRSPQEQSAFIAGFAEAARKGRIDALLAMISPATRRAAGDEATRANLRNVVAPFFAKSTRLHSDDTTRRATLPDGRMGMWHYTYAVDAAGKPMPFRIGLIAEDGVLHAGFVEVGKCIRDRHAFCD